MLFGGAGTGYNFAFWNPFIFLHSEQMNGSQDGNTLLPRTVSQRRGAGI